MTRKKRLTFREKMKNKDDENRKNKLRNRKNIAHIMFLVFLVSLYIYKFKHVYWLIYVLVFINFSKLLWMETFKDKTKVMCKDALGGYYTKINEFLFGEGYHDDDIQPYDLLLPIHRTAILIFSIVYIIKTKSRSVYMYMFMCVSFVYLFFSYNIKYVRENIISSENMYGGNLYFATVLAILLYLEYKNNLKIKNSVPK
jgi:magnesium-transporting ATPase (P-type)